MEMVAATIVATSGTSGRKVTYPLASINALTATPVSESRVAGFSAAGAVSVNDSDKNVARLTLDREGTILEGNSSAGVLLHSGPGALAGLHISALIPQLKNLPVIQAGEINSKLRFLCRLDYRFLTLSPHGASFYSRLFFNLLDSAVDSNVSLILRPTDDTFA